MKRISGGIVALVLFTLLLLRIGVLESPVIERSPRISFPTNSSDHLNWLNSVDPPAVARNQGNDSQFISNNTLFSDLSSPRNLSDSEQWSVQNSLSVNSSEQLYWLNVADPPAAAPNPGNEFQAISTDFLISNLSSPRNLSKSEQWSVQNSLSVNSSEQLNWLNVADPPAAAPNPGNEFQAISTDFLFSNLFSPINLSESELQPLQTWKHLDKLVSTYKILPNAVTASLEAVAAWQSLLTSVEEEKSTSLGKKTAETKVKEKLCPYSISSMNALAFLDNSFKLVIPCGLIQGSSITIIGTPRMELGEFRIELVGAALKGEENPPIILHYNVRLLGDQIDEDPVIVQNTWTAADEWGDEERCPSPATKDNQKVDDLEQCSAIMGTDKSVIMDNKKYNFSTRPKIRNEGAKTRRYFPFRQGYLAIATIRIGLEGIQMSVDGKHITSFAYRQSLEPWLVNEVRVSGDMKLISVLASGLPTSEDTENIMDLEILKSAPVTIHKSVKLLIGVLSTANNFKNRMAVRRTWMRFDAVRSGTVVVRFFVGLHKSQAVNEELWNEACTYGDIQLMPFVDYYTLITWKSIAICVYGTQILSAKYVMKTDDDAFVRVDELLASLKKLNTTHGLLYGHMNFDTEPHRKVTSKWYIAPEEWPEEKYPPWANGPGYIVSRDIAKAIYKQYRKGHLKMFKLEDVAMGIWVDEIEKKGLHINYVDESRINIDGCQSEYIVAHYQGPREMLCLWQKLQETHQAICCG